MRPEGHGHGTSTIIYLSRSHKSARTCEALASVVTAPDQADYTGRRSVVLHNNLNMSDELVQHVLGGLNRKVCPHGARMNFCALVPTPGKSSVAQNRSPRSLAVLPTRAL